ncbi:MAG: hypothetical protein LBC94_08410 [Desulfovibrio sp.]|jgi:hypothetical protein|nr:hypothetical protein [Desulfovibrio sp.]
MTSRISSDGTDATREAVRLFSECKAGARETLETAGLGSYGELLDALGVYGFPYPSPLPEEELDRMVRLIVEVIDNKGCLRADYDG